MPTYEYLCQACSHRFETWQKMTDEPLTVCPECGGHIRRVLYPSGIIFKGSGFYKTDHPGSSSNGSSTSSTESKSSTESSSSSSTNNSTSSSESKTATAAGS